ncbi:MAG: hypothetical protein N3D81_00250 [Spirochaetes bacterium]|nr:hypothetical protein [Spirochaetota bacterium]
MLNRILPITLFILLLTLISEAQSLLKEYHISQINDFIKSSAPFKDGFVFSTPKKLYYFEITTKKLTEVKEIETRLVDRVITSLSASQSYVFVGTSRGVIILNDRFSVVREITQERGLKDQNITFLFSDAKYLYIGTRSWGFYNYDYLNNSLGDSPTTVVNGLVDNFIRDIKFSVFDKVVASSEGFSSFDYLSYLYTSYSSSEYPILSGAVMSVIPYGDTIFIGTSLGLLSFNRRTEQLRRLSYSSAVFSVNMIGKNIIMATYDGLIVFDTETGSYEFQQNELLRKPIASTISILKDKVFVGFDNRQGTFAILEYQKPFLKIQDIKYLSRTNVLVSLYGNKVNSISSLDVSLVSLNLGRVFNVKPQVKRLSEGMEIVFNTSELLDDTYVLNIDYYYEGNKETIKDTLIVRSKPPTISFSPIPLFYNQRSIEIVGRTVALDVDIQAFINGRKETLGISRTQNRILVQLNLLEGTNNIQLVQKDSFNNQSTNSLSVIVDTVAPNIISEDGNRIVEKNGRFTFRVVDTYHDRVVFSETVSNLVETQQSDGVIYSMFIPNRNTKKIRIVAYDKAGNSSSREFDVQFSELKGEIVLSSLPQQTRDPNIPLSFEMKGDFRRVLIYRQGIPIASIEKPPQSISTNIQLESGRNLIRIEGYLANGQVVNTSAVVEYIRTFQVAETTTSPQTTVDSGNFRDEIDKLKKENEELRKRVSELEEMIKSLSEGKVTTRVIIKDESIDNIPSIIRVQYNPAFDNFARVSKRLYGSESYSVYFYYLLRNTSISRLVSEKGYLIAPNKRLMDILIKTGDLSVFETLSSIIEWWIMKELGQSETLSSIASRMNAKFSNGRLVSQKGYIISYSYKGNYLPIFVSR